MNAIYQQKLYRVGDDLNECLLLDYETGEEVMRVDYGSETLIVDPTDNQVEAARQGLPIPPESELRGRWPQPRPAAERAASFKEE